MLDATSIGLTGVGAVVTLVALMAVRPKALKALFLVFGVSALAVGLALLAGLLVLR